VCCCAALLSSVVCFVLCEVFMLVVNRKKCVFDIHSKFADILDAELLCAAEKLQLERGAGSDPFAGGAILIFRDPDYSFENGGYHPVEVCINDEGILCYVTDFSHVGKPPFVELAKELDFAFEVGRFDHMGREFPLAEGCELFAIFQSNVVSYYDSEVFTVEVSD